MSKDTIDNIIFGTYLFAMGVVVGIWFAVVLKGY